MIYFIQVGEHGPIKIGTSRRLMSRLQTIVAEIGCGATLIGQMDGGQMEEMALHRRFAALRIVGEWFAPSAELLELISGEGRQDGGVVSILPASNSDAASMPFAQFFRYAARFSQGALPRGALPVDPRVIPRRARHVGQKVRALRASIGMSQTELAALMGLKQAQISYIEIGQRPPSLDTIYALAVALNCPPSALDSRLTNELPESAKGDIAPRISRLIPAMPLPASVGMVAPSPIVEEDESATGWAG